MTPKLYKAAEVCEMVQVQPYVLRSWEKEFPGIGIQRSPESPRLYRQSDVEQVQRIKQLVFGEGLTVGGARRKLETSAPPVSAVSESEAAEVLDALGADARTRIVHVRDGLREIHALLSGAPGSGNGKVRRLSDFALTPPAGKSPRAKAVHAASRRKPVKRGAAPKAQARRKTHATKRRRGHA